MSQFEDEEIARNLVSIVGVPAEVLPDGQARQELLLLAASGSYARAYRRDGEWFIWLQELAEARSDQNGSVPMASWVRYWTRYLNEAAIEVWVPDAAREREVLAA